MISLQNQVAVVTGGSRGIGAAIVRLFCRAGANVVFSYRRDAAAAERLAHECGKSAIAIHAEAARLRDAERLIEQAVRRFEHLDILVANAGIWNSEDISVDRMSERQWDEMLAINLKGVFAVTRYAVAQMKQQSWGGRIIAISSTAGQRGEAFHSHYAASKGGIISFVKSLATELASYNILVNCVAPGWAETDMARPVMRTAAGRRQVLSAIPLRRVADPEEIAGPVLFLASELASFITGEILNVNGGAVLVG